MDILILGQKWTVHLVDEETYVKKHGDDSEAITKAKERKIYYNQEELSRKTVLHELVHAFFSECCTSSAHLEADQVEEVFAELFSEHGDHMIRMARKLYKTLREE